MKTGRGQPAEREPDVAEDVGRPQRTHGLTQRDAFDLIAQENRWFDGLGCGRRMRVLPRQAGGQPRGAQRRGQHADGVRRQRSRTAR